MVDHESRADVRWAGEAKDLVDDAQVAEAAEVVRFEAQDWVAVVDDLAEEKASDVVVLGFLERAVVLYT